MSDNNKIPIYFDASALKNSSCFRNFWRIAVEGWRKIGDETARGHAMAYGSGIHKFLEHIYKGGTKKDALQLALDYYTPWNVTLNLNNAYEFRTSANLLKVCNQYYQRFIHTLDNNIPMLDFIPLEDSKTGIKQVEYKFQIKIWENDKYVLYLCGTIDLICLYEGYDILLVDHKSTSSKLNEQFFIPFEWDIQTMLYSKVWRETNNLASYPPVLINGIFVKKPTIKNSKGGIFDGVEFDRSPVIEYDDARMDAFTVWLNSRIKSIIYYLENESNPSINPIDNYDMAACKSIYGNCQFFNICKLPAEFQQGALEGSFEIFKYNPLCFRD